MRAKLPGAGHQPTFGFSEPTVEGGTDLFGKFLIPPFSVLDARQGYWQERKSAWIGLGIESEVGRGASVAPGGQHAGPETASGWLTKTRGGTYRAGDRAIQNRATAPPYSGGAAPWRQHDLSGRRVNVSGPRNTREGSGAPASWPSPNPDMTPQESAATSIFDPVLTELVYRWFSPVGGSVFDPFAGGSVRGIVAALLGRPYTGIELRAEQVQANPPQWDTVWRKVGSPPLPAPRWVTGDSRNAATLAPGAYDFVFSCPPYADLERYSEDPADLSTMGWPEFCASYRQIIDTSLRMLHPDRFACFVVGNVRDRATGLYRNLPGETILAFQMAGASLYNDAVLVTAVGSLPIRTSNLFPSGRKLGRTHQNVLVFVKGDPRRAVAACGPVEVGIL